MTRTTTMGLLTVLGMLLLSTSLTLGAETSRQAIPGAPAASSPDEAEDRPFLISESETSSSKPKAAKKRRPTYKPPSTGRPWRTIGGATRSLSGPLPDLAVLAPHDHSGRTLEEQPTLYFYISGAPTTPVEFTLLDEEGIAPLVETELTVPPNGGIQAVRLADHGVTLKPGQQYHWFIALVQDREHRSKDVIAEAGIERVMPEETLTARLAGVQGAEAAFAFAEAGLWYDALEAVSELIASDPGNEELQALREALLEQVELNRVIGASPVTTAPTAG